MINRYKRAPTASEFFKKPLPWILIAGAAVIVIILFATIPPAMNGGGGGGFFAPAKSGTLIDFETDDYKSHFYPQKATETTSVVKKDGSNVLVMNGTGYYHFKFPKITDGVYAGKTFGYTVYTSDVNTQLRFEFGTSLTIGKLPSSYGAVTVLNTANYIQVQNLTSTSSTFVSCFYQNKTVIPKTAKSVFEFTMLSQTTFSVKINGFQVCDSKGNTAFAALDFSTFEYFSYFMGSTGSTIMGYLDNIHVSWA